MIYYLTKVSNERLVSFIGIIFAFAFTCILLYSLSKLLPKDMGRDFAHDGKLSAGKPRGAGFLFIIAFIITDVFFIKINREIIVYLIFIAAEMLTGFLDDCAKIPWEEYKKGVLDFVIAFMVSVSFINFNSSEIRIDSLNIDVTINPILYVILATILIWASINVTNCSDGVDGLSGLLTIVTLMTLFGINQIKQLDSNYNCLIIIFCMCILGYLWYNITPSLMMMGDAGSRAMGLFIAISTLKTGNPLLFIPVAFLIIMDGGLGLLKVSLLRFFKIKILTGVRTPLHDHVRKAWNWSNTHVVFRFATIQVIISIIVIYTILITSK
jgi:phospho-N-acetylmuramoyl-pentapeptide-transferase